MAETLTIRTASSTEVVKIAVQGPQGPKGDKGDPGDVAGLPLNTQGDTLYRGASQNERLPIGTAGQILRVSSGGIPEWGAAPSGVSSWNDLTDKPASFTPSAHSSTHHTGGTDALAAHQINGQTIFSTGTPTYSTDQTLGAARALQLTVSNTNASGINLTLPVQSDGTLNGDTYVIIGGSTVSGPITIRRINVLSPLIYETLATITTTGQQYRFRATGATTGGWTLVPVDSHTHPSTQITGLGTAATADIGTGAGDVCEGNDARLSDSRTPTAHAASHASSGSDPLAPSDIGAANDSHTHDLNDLTRTGVMAGDIIVRNDNNNGWDVTTGTAWAGLNISAADIGAASGDHTHGNLTNDGKLGSTAGLPVVTTTAGAVTTLALGTANQVLRVNSGATGVEFADPAASGISAIGASAADILSVSGSDLVADDLGADKLYGWDDSAGKAIGFTIGSGLTITDDTISASGGIGGSTGSTDNLLLRSDGTGAATLQNSALQLDDATTSTQANVAIVNAHSETNSALVLSPKGTGAFIIGPKPDGTSTGGNARGLKAVDLSFQRNAATQVASGNYSMVLGGDRCTASGVTAIAGGERATASGSYAVAFGRTATASGTAATVIGGQDNTASGQESIAAGNLSSASAHIAMALGGYALADRSGMMAQANGTFGAGTSADGTAQWIHMVLRAKTTTNSAVELLINNARITNGRLTCPSGKIISGIINIHGVKSDGSASAHYVRQFQVKNVGGTSSYPYTAAIVGTDYASSTSITFNDPDTNGDALSVSVTGIASETWRWTAHVSAVETTYGT